MRATPGIAGASDGPPKSAGDLDARLRELDAKIAAGMDSYGIPGVAVGLLAGGREYLKGYGVTNVDYPVPVDPDTVFRIQSTTKTFTGTTVMRLVEQGRIDLDATVRTYLPDFLTADASVAANVTVRQLLNHSAGWLGDDLLDTGPGEAALARYVAAMADLPQLTPLGRVFAYNNAGIIVAGRIVETVTGSTCAAAMKTLLLDPLGLDHSRFFTDEIVGFNIAAPHKLVEGNPTVDSTAWAQPQCHDPTGGLISSVRDQIRYARFHLGNGMAGDGTPLLTPESLLAMRSNPGPGGTLVVELNGMGVTWMLRPSAEGDVIVQHGGSGPGQYSGFIMVPSRNFALTVLTNSDGGPQLLSELFADDWALRRFAGVSNLPATPQRLSASDLAPYEGHYVAYQIDEKGSMGEVDLELKAGGGTLQGRQSAGGAALDLGMAFYRNDYVLDLDDQGLPVGTRSDFIRGPDGAIAWFRSHGRLYARQN
jgi:CubicO group peptidase (beta-lactamase class C family)